MVVVAVTVCVPWLEKVPGSIAVEAAGMRVARASAALAVAAAGVDIAAEVLGRSRLLAQNYTVDWAHHHRY